MLCVTDIPDWVVCEGLGQYDFDFKIGGSEMFTKLFEKSPIRYVDNVNLEILLMFKRNCDLV